jgi:hypothetical protein
VEDEIVGSRVAVSVDDETVGVLAEPLEITALIVEELDHRLPPQQRAPWVVS